MLFLLVFGAEECAGGVHVVVQNIYFLVKHFSFSLFCERHCWRHTIDLAFF